LVAVVPLPVDVSDFRLVHKTSDRAFYDEAKVRAGAFEVVFTDPEIAWAGLTEQEVKASGKTVEISRYPWAASGRAQALGRTEGMTKLLVDPETDTVLGVGIVGAGAGELIAEGALAIEMAASARDLAETIHAHPTLGETVAFAAENHFGTATEIYRPRS
jgi:dihydrolipoamide dehydrogenase